MLHETSDILLVVAAALIDGDGRVLVQQRPSGKTLAGLWEFPGGKMEAGELPEAALARELREELGIEIAESALRPAAFASQPLGGRHLLMLLYTLRQWQGDPVPLDAAALQWVTTGEMRMLAMPPADVPLIALLEALL